MEFHPEAVLICGAGFVLAFMYVPRMYADGLLDMAEAVAIAAAFLILTALLLGLYGTSLGYGASAVFILALGSLPYVRRAVNRRSLRRLAHGDLIRARQAIHTDSGNVGAHLYCAKAYRDMGLLDQSLASFEDALSHSPRDIEARREYETTVQLRRWHARETWLCLLCQAENPPSRRSCFRCGGYLPRMALYDTRLARYSVLILPTVGAVLGTLAIIGVLGPRALIGLCVLASLVVVSLYAFLIPDPED